MNPSIAAARLGLLVAFLATLCAASALAQEVPRELLNSERIAAKFGSYAVMVLEQDAGLRVSNLYTGDGAAATCRTFAIVRYSQSIDARLAREHAAIVAGGSLGAVFAAAGWQVRKAHLHYGELEASPRLATLMQVAPKTRLAQHVYVLDVAKEGVTIEYATLVEIHHPDYLRREDLASIYGPADTGNRAELLAALLAVAAERAR